MNGARPKKPRRRVLEPGINLTPLLDAIFNLIFFFLLATTLREEELGAEVALPSSEVGRVAESKADSITLTADDRIFFRGEEIIEEVLELEMRALAGRGVREIAIRGDTDASIGLLRSVMDVCTRSGLEAISLLADSRDELLP
jgi:biopolymer transport protein ExbD